MAKRSGGGGGGNKGIGDRARAALEKTMSLDELLAKLSARDRTNVDRHLAALEAEADPKHAALWKRIAKALATLAPHAITTTGQQAVSFFIADGKYRMQVFAMEDNRDGKVLIYAVDALDEAIKAQVIKPPAKGAPDPNDHPISNGQALSVESLTNENTPNPSAFYKHMLGWNRKAVRITLPHDASTQQIEAAEQLCAVAAVRWAPKDAAAT
jgi:hypothetical protein